jgi:hypothetical protein
MSAFQHFTVSEFQHFPSATPHAISGLSASGSAFQLSAFQPFSISLFRLPSSISPRPVKLEPWHVEVKLFHMLLHQVGPILPQSLTSHQAQNILRRLEKLVPPLLGFQLGENYRSNGILIRVG